MSNLLQDMIVSLVALCATAAIVYTVSNDASSCMPNGRRCFTNDRARCA